MHIESGEIRNSSKDHECLARGIQQQFCVVRQLDHSNEAFGSGLRKTAKPRNDRYLQLETSHRDSASRHRRVRRIDRLDRDAAATSCGTADHWAIMIP
jgi:hypothetical protein